MNIVNKNGKSYLVEGDKMYRLDHPTNGATIPGRQLAQVERGDYGALVQKIYQAQEQIGVSHRFAWRGIMNSLGDYGEVLPPTNPIPA